jgi:hypothetical protein
MRTEILPPDFVTRFGFSLCQINFANRWSSANFTVSADVSKACGKASKTCFVPSMSSSHKASPADTFCNVLIAKVLCKFAARETDLGHPRSDKSRNGPDGISAIFLP